MQLIAFARQNRSSVVAALLMFLLTFGLNQVIYGWSDAHDDAYITYTYARQIADGHGFVYSPGEAPTQGTTTPLYTLLLSFLYLSGVPPHLSSPFVNSLCNGLIAVTCFMLGQYLAGATTGLVAGLLWCIQLGVFWRCGGMETALLMLLVMLSAWQALTDVRLRYVGMLLGLALLTRSDVLLLVLLAFVFLSFDPSDRRRVPKALVTMALLAMPWLIYSTLTFGTIVPTSFRAKLLHRGLISGQFSLDHFLEYFLPLSFGKLLLIGLVGLFAVGTAEIWRRWPRLRAFAAWVPLYYLSMWWARAPDFGWYYVPPLPVAFVVIAVGLNRSSSCIRSGPLRRILFTACAAGICISVLCANWQATQYLRHPDLRMTGHRFLADRVRHLFGPGRRVASVEVGNLGYWSESRVLDLLGLVSPEVHPALQNWDFGAMLRQFKPDLVLSAWMQDVLPAEGYRVVEVYPFAANAYYRIWQRLEQRPYRIVAGAVEWHGNATQLESYRLPSDGVVWFDQPLAEPYMLHGWSFVETGWGTWAVAQQADLLVDLPTGRPWSVRILIMPFEAPSLPDAQTVELSVNGHSAGIHRMGRASSVQKLDWELPSAWVAPPLDRVVLRFGRLTRPSDLGPSTDTRTLAAALRRMRFIKQ